MRKTGIREALLYNNHSIPPTLNSTTASALLVVACDGKSVPRVGRLRRGNCSSNALLATPVPSFLSNACIAAIVKLYNLSYRTTSATSRSRMSPTLISFTFTSLSSPAQFPMARISLSSERRVCSTSFSVRTGVAAPRTS